MSDDSIADDLLRNGYERWLRLEEAKAEVSDDIKELMAELKGHGFTPKAVRESFRRVRNADDADKQEHDAIVDLYVASLTRARPAPAREKTLNNSRSYAEEKGRGAGERLIDAAREMRATVGAITIENTNSPDATPVEAKTGEAPSSSQASPVADFDPVRDIPSFMRRTDKGSMAQYGHGDTDAVPT